MDHCWQGSVSLVGFGVCWCDVKLAKTDCVSWDNLWEWSYSDFKLSSPNLFALSYDFWFFVKKYAGFVHFKSKFTVYIGIHFCNFRPNNIMINTCQIQTIGFELYNSTF